LIYLNTYNQLFRTIATIGLNEGQKIAIFSFNFFITLILIISILLFRSTPPAIYARTPTRTPVGPLLHFLINTRTGFCFFFLRTENHRVILFVAASRWSILLSHCYIPAGQRAAAAATEVHSFSAKSHTIIIRIKKITTRNSIHIPTGTAGILK